MFDNQLGDRVPSTGQSPCGSFGSGGFLSNLDNAYVYAFVSRGFGPLVVLHGKAPTFAATYPNAPTMPGDVQLPTGPSVRTIRSRSATSPAVATTRSQMGAYYPGGRYFTDWRAVAKAAC